MTLKLKYLHTPNSVELAGDKTDRYGKKNPHCLECNST